MGETLLNLRVLGVDSSKILKFKAQEFLFELERKKMAVMANLRISGSTSCFKQSHLHPFPTCSSVSRVSGTTGTTPLDLDDLGFRGSGTTGTTGTTGTARLPSMVSSDMGRSPVAESSCAIGCGYPGRFAFEPTEPR